MTKTNNHRGKSQRLSLSRTFPKRDSSTRQTAWVPCGGLTSHLGGIAMLLHVVPAVRTCTCTLGV